MNGNEIFALMLTVFAGLATTIGSTLAVITKKTNAKFLGASLAFSAGVMIYVSMIEIFSKARNYITGATNDITGYILTVCSFFAGIFIICLIDYFIPSTDGDIGSSRTGNDDKLKRMGFVTALAIGIHNFPEGMATFTSALTDPHLGIAIAVAIAIHNIPEGIATAAPIYFATGSKKRAFMLSFLSGVTEPIGALLGYLILKPFFNDIVFGILFASVAGIMVFIAIEELLPMAREYEKSKLTIAAVILGMIVMAVSLLMFL